MPDLKEILIRPLPYNPLLKFTGKTVRDSEMLRAVTGVGSIFYWAEYETVLSLVSKMGFWLTTQGD